MPPTKEVYQWINYLRSLTLTDHTQSIDGDEKYDHITEPDFKKVLNKTYFAKLLKCDNFDASFIEELEDCLDEDGGSPNDIKKELLDILNGCIQPDIDLIYSQVETDKTLIYNMLLKNEGDIAKAIVDVVEHIGSIS